MMLVQKPQNFLLAAPAAYSHRRHPSAPVVVQPTRTPGLLSLSKPPVQQRPSPQRQLPSQQRRPAPKTVAKSRSQVLAPAPEVGGPETPSPAARGRSQAKQGAKDKHRSSSQSLLRAKHGRQPSPPITIVSSQAEAPVVFPIQSANLFDPFSDDNNASPPPSPTLSKPTGKLARRRQQQQRSASPSPQAVSKAIPVPHSRAVPTNNIARSDPLPSNMRPRPVPKRSSTFQDFPICDDMNEKSTTKVSPPSTPPRRPTTNFVGPRTAPLSAIPSAGFPFDSTPPAMKRGTRKHQRVPSEGMFGMSSDEDVSTGAGGVILNPNVQALFGLVNSGSNKRSSLPATPAPTRVNVTTPIRSSGPPPFGQLSREQELEREALEKAGYYASSMFQNSPSPEELPDPLLL